MKQSVGLWQFWGFAATSLVGTLLHFLYDWTNNSPLVAPFSGVNESTWEHMKLLFWPLFAFAILQYFFFRDRQDFWCIKRNGIFLGLLLIPTLFYTYNGVIGPSPDWINIAIFFLSAASVYLYETRLFGKGTLSCKHPKLAFALLCLIAVSFAVFTFFTPELGIFRDPVTGTYGIG